MKTAEEWMKTLEGRLDYNANYYIATKRGRLIRELIPEIQADALGHAAEIVWDTSSDSAFLELFHRLKAEARTVAWKT